MRRLLEEEKSRPIPTTAAVSATLSDAYVPTLLRLRTLVLGMAAALLLFALGWLVLQTWLDASPAPPSKPVTNALLASLFVCLCGLCASARNSDLKSFAQRRRER